MARTYIALGKGGMNTVMISLKELDALPAGEKIRMAHMIRTG